MIQPRPLVTGELVTRRELVTSASGGRPPDESVKDPLVNVG